CLAALLAVGLAPALPAAAGDTPPAGEWLVEDIDGGGVIDRARTTLAFLDEGRIAGSGGCNRYNAPFTLAGDELTIDLAASTSMLCPQAVMDQERKFLAALAEVRGWSIENGMLRLRDAEGAS